MVHLPSRPSAGTTIAGPIVGDHSCADPFVHPVDVAKQAAAWRAMQREQRLPVGRTPLTERKRTTVRRRNHASLSHRLSLSLGLLSCETRGRVDGDAEATGAAEADRVGVEFGVGRSPGGAALVPQPTGARTATRATTARNSRLR